MSAVELIALASTSLLAGWRLYLVTLVTGLAMKFGWIALPEQLHALDVLGNNWLLATAALGTLAEFFADKIAWIDSAWDAIHSVIRPLGGALLSLAIVDSGDATWQVASFLLGGGAARSPMPVRPARAPSSTPAPNRSAMSSSRPARSRHCRPARRWRSPIRSPPP